MSGPQDPAAAGRGQFRASHADRERVIELLKTAFVQDRLTKDELDMRAGQALSARTYAELTALTASIPAEPAAAGLARRSAPARRGPLARAAVKSGICLMITAVAIGGLLLPVDPGGLSPWSGLMVFLAVSGLWTAVGIMACAVVTSWDQRSHPIERLRDAQRKVTALRQAPSRTDYGEAARACTLAQRAARSAARARARRGDRGLRGRMDVRIPRAWPGNPGGDPPHAVALLVYLATFIYLCVVAMTLWLSGAVLVESWLKRHSGVT